MKLSTYNGVRLTVEYKMSRDGQIVAVGETNHCFLNKKGIPIRLNKECKELDDILKKGLKEG